MAERKLPYIQFWVDDWRADACIKGCCPAARGVWLEMLLVMHQSPERGYFLSESGQIMTDEMFARLTGFTAEEIRVTRALLERDMVYSIDGRGIAFNRKMVREEAIKKAARERQSKRRKKIKPSSNVTLNVTHDVTVDVTPDVTDIVPESQSPIVLESQRPTFAADKPPRKRTPDPIWDAVVSKFFPDGIAKSQQSRAGRIVSDLKSVNATPDEIRRRMDNYASHFADCALTPEALVKHWATCAARKGSGAAIDPMAEARERYRKFEEDRERDLVEFGPK